MDYNKTRAGVVDLTTPQAAAPVTYRKVILPSDGSRVLAIAGAVEIHGITTVPSALGSSAVIVAEDWGRGSLEPPDDDREVFRVPAGIVADTQELPKVVFPDGVTLSGGDAGLSYVILHYRGV